MASRFYFNGNSFLTPVTASAISDTGFAPANPGLGSILVIIGNSAGGQPNVPLAFTDPNQAASILVSGDLLTAIQKAFAPSTGISGTASQIIGMVVGQATPATTVLNDSSGVAALTLTSTQYGVPAGQTQVMVTPGSNSTALLPTVKASVRVGTALQSQDNIGRVAMVVSYSGVQASATVQVSANSIKLAAPAGTVVATIDLTKFTTVDQAAAQINAVTGFTAVLGLNASGTPSLNGLDFAPTAQSCMAPFSVTATTQAVLEWFNGPNSTMVTAARPGPATGLQLGATGWVSLTGNTAPTPVFSDWTNALNALQTVNCQIVCPLSGDPAVHAATDAHVQYMSQVARKERRAFVGPSLGTSLAAVELLPAAINSNRTAMCYPGYVDYNAAGQLVTLDSWQTAAMVAACFAGLNPGDAMTNQTVAARGLEVTIRNPTDTDPLIQAGVLCLTSTKQGYKVVRSISTWLQDNTFDHVEVSTGFAVDYAIRTIREAVDVQRGKRQGPLQLGQVMGIAESALNGLAKPPPIGPGVIVGDANSPAWQNLTGSIVGDQLLLNFQMSPVIPNNFIGVSVGLYAYSGTASA